METCAPLQSHAAPCTAFPSPAWEGELAANLVRQKARRLAHFIRLSPEEVEDIQQDLLLDLWKRWPSFDPRISSPEQFMGLVLRNKIALLLKRRRSEKHRLLRSFLSLDERIDTEDDQPLTRAATHADLRDPSGHAAEQNLQLAETIARMSPRLRRLCQVLGEKSITEAAVLFHTDRSNLYRDRSAIQRKLMQSNAARKIRRNK